MRAVLRVIAIVVLSLELVAAPARADALHDAKAAGQVGERIDGYLGVVAADTPDDVRALVDRINAKRQAKYQEIADAQDAPIAAVAQITGKKLIERAPSGEYILDADGEWRQK